MEENLIPTGLKKKCPRCGREGEVFYLIYNNGDPEFEIRWEANAKRKIDFDKGITFSQLISNEIGCGFDQ